MMGVEKVQGSVLRACQQLGMNVVNFVPKTTKQRENTKFSFTESSPGGEAGTGVFELDPLRELACRGITDAGFAWNQLVSHTSQDPEPKINKGFLNLRLSSPEHSCHSIWVAEDYAPFDWLLPLASVVICHGGAGTTFRSLWAGAPVVVCARGSSSNSIL